jgi:hypothetical protein
VPPAPPRPQGIERNVVITLWEVDTDKSFIHDVVSTNERNPTENAYGPVYAADFEVGRYLGFESEDNTKIHGPGSGAQRKPTENSCPRLPQNMLAPSPYWGNEMIWNDTNYIALPHMDSKGRIWFQAQTRPGLSDYCKKGSGNPFAENFPMPDKGIPGISIITILRRANSN